MFIEHVKGVSTPGPLHRLLLPPVMLFPPDLCEIPSLTSFRSLLGSHHITLTILNKRALTPALTTCCFPPSVYGVCRVVREHNMCLDVDVEITCSVVSDPLRPLGLYAPLSMGFPRLEYWSGLPFPSPGDLPDPEIEAASPALAGGLFTTVPPGKSLYSIYLLPFFF